jgi:hypothetical protein
MSDANAGPGGREGALLPAPADAPDRNLAL